MRSNPAKCRLDFTGMCVLSAIHDIRQRKYQTLKRFFCTPFFGQKLNKPPHTGFVTESSQTYVRSMRRAIRFLDFGKRLIIKQGYSIFLICDSV